MIQKLMEFMMMSMVTKMPVVMTQSQPVWERQGAWWSLKTLRDDLRRTKEILMSAELRAESLLANSKSMLSQDTVESLEDIVRCALAINDAYNAVNREVNKGIR